MSGGTIRLSIGLRLALSNGWFLGVCLCKRFDKDKWLKSGSLKRKPEDDAYDLSEGTEKVSDCNSSKNPATSVHIPEKENF